MAAQSLLDLARAAEHRFWPKVDKRGPEECWLWTGAADGPGYGHLQIGRLPDGMCTWYSEGGNVLVFGYSAAAVSPEPAPSKVAETEEP